MTKNKDEESTTTSHWASSEEDCEKMAEKYSWDLVETNRDDSKILPVECVYDGEAEFPKSGIDYSAGGDDEQKD